MKQLKRFIWIVVYFTVIIAIMYLLYMYVNTAMKHQLLNSISEISELNLNRIHDIVYERMWELEKVASNYTNIDEEEFEKKIEGLDEIADLMQFKEIGLAKSDGTAYTTENTIFNVAKRDYFKRAMKGEQDISDILSDLRTDETVIVYSTPIKDADGNVKEVLFGIDDIDAFVDIFQTTLFKGQGYTYLINENGDLIFKSPLMVNDFDNIFDSYKQFPNNTQVIKDIKENMKDNTSFSYYVNNFGYRYTNMSKTDINNWWIVVGVSESVIKDQVDSITNVIKVVIISFFFISLGILIFYLRMHKRHEEKLQKIAYVDRLTGIYNTEYLQENYQKILKKVQGKHVALVTFDVIKFKMINEVYGEQIGDVILTKIASYLRKERHDKCELIVRDHADEFIGLYVYDHKEELEDRLRKIVSALDVIQYRKNKVKVKLSIGIYDHVVGKYPLERIIGYARIAMSENKQQKGTFHYFSEDLKDYEMKQKELLDSIQDAIKKEEFKAWLQPQYLSSTQEMVAAEALVRWHREDGKILTPYHFIEFCEKSGLIQEIDQLVLEDVCRKQSAWMKQGLPIVPIGVNLSRAYLNDVDSIYSIKEIVDKYEIPTSYIKLEITESAITNREEELIEIIRVMHELGFGVSLDDFGVGYSSLVSINNLNFDVLKIDKSFVDAIGTEKGNALISYTITLAKNLGMKLIAEGIETKKQYEFLKALQCDAIQGYYFSKPLSVEEFENLLKGE